MAKFKHISIALAAFKLVPPILSFVKTKFQQYQDSEKAKQFYQSDDLEQSTVFQGDKELEMNKQFVFQKMEEIQKQIINFLDKYNFQKLYDTNKIKQHFYNEKMNYCMINLQEIVKDEFQIFTTQLGTTNEIIWLNQAITKVYYLLIIYYQGKFKQINKEDEFLLYFDEILEFIQFNILKRAKQCFSQTYDKLEKLLKCHCEVSIKMNNQLDNLKSQFQMNYKVKHYQQRISEIYNNIIENYNEETLEEVKVKYLIEESLEARNKFKISEVLLNEGHKIIRKRIKYEILNSLQNYKERDFSILMTKVRNIIIKQIHEDNFVGGIADQEINQNLQLILVQQFWCLIKNNNPTIEFLFKELGKQSDIKDKFSQISLEDLDGTQSQDLKEQYIILRKAVEKAQIWYEQNVDEDTNLLVICQIYMILANFKFKNQKVYFGEYDSEARNTLFIIVENLKDLEYGYFNHEILKLCESFTHKLQTRFFEDIDQKIQKEKQNGLNSGELFKQRSEILIHDKSYHFLLQDTSVSLLKSPTAIGREYHQQNQLFECILKSKQPNSEYLENQIKLIKREFKIIEVRVHDQQIMGNYKFVQPLQQPKLFYFTPLSTDENNSNVITLLISGFLSKNTDKQDLGKHLLKKLSGTVLAMNWETKEITDFLKEIPNWIFEYDKAEILDRSLQKNQFIQANQEAIMIGRCLAHFLDGGNLFGNRQINIICHSLGTQILLDCVHELDRFSQKKCINDIVLFGGVADVNELAKRRWNSVSGSIHNMYIKDDTILQYLYRVNYLFKKPCGYKPVKFAYKKIYNYDLSEMIDGHSGYWEKLDIMMNICDLNSDYKVLVKDVKKKF
ncbi:unnamed protein product [Paramecium octaurelia]|uniref:Uncharacterized protein n=1 Tax=Paramecium octaurelia TaxID=43137 RepID=A0A8S1VZN5_PAROT|nr:unnamed protein product [Paramecium octaurelia]